MTGKGRSAEGRKATVIGDLPQPPAGIDRRIHPAWQVARDHPGQWVKTDLSVHNIAQKRRNYPDFEVEVRDKTTYIRYKKENENGNRKK